LIYISYSYTGWNAAAYVAGEIRNPRRNLPIALGLGTLIVTALYLGLNVLYLAAVPYEQLAGVETVAHRAASQLFGTEAARFVSLLLAVGLVSMVGAIIMTGSRVYETVCQDFTALSWLARRRPRGGPTIALLVQAAVAIAMIAVGNLQTIIEYVGFTLALFSALTVCGVFVIRRRVADSEATFRMPGYPVTPLVFVLLMGWVVAVSIYQKPFISLIGVGTLVSGFILYLVAMRSLRK
jgi:basic amino acid/polyamine antiporter, APA family